MSRAGISVYKTVHYEDEDVWEIEIENTAGLELPASGGTGTHIFYIAGIIMIIAAAALYVSRRRIAA